MNKILNLGLVVLVAMVSSAAIANENDSASESEANQAYQADPAIDKEDKFSMLNLLRVPVSKTFTNAHGYSFEICYDDETYEKLDCSEL